MRAFDLHATASGYVVKFGEMGREEPVAEYRDFKDASAGYHLARKALAMLDAALAKPLTAKGI